MAPSEPLSFAEVLRRCRAAAGLTQEQVAERAGLSVRGISDLERGINRSPRPDTIERLVKALNLTRSERAWMLAASGAAQDAPRSTCVAACGANPGAARYRLVGRERELEQLAQHLAGDGPPLMILAGEPGIGKTRLLQEAAERGRAAGWTVLSGGCHRRGGQEPFAPILEALQGRLRGRRRAHVLMDTQGCGWLVRMLPELAEVNLTPVPSWTLESEQEQRLVFDAVARFLGNVAGALGTLLVLDDLQWAGADALALLATLVRTRHEHAIRIVAGYRDTEIGPRDALGVLLADLAPAGDVARLPIGPLPDAAACQLLASLLEARGGVDPDVEARLLRRAGGMPFFLVSCAQALRTGALDGVAARDIPWDAAQSIRQRVAAVSPLARELLEVAAVAGREIPSRLLLRVGVQLGHVRRALGPAIAALCDARLLENTTHAYRFPHDLIREAVIADLGEARRVTLHEEVAAALEAAGDPVPAEVLAYHYAEAGDAPRAVVYLERAGDHARSILAGAEAEEQYRRLIARLEELGRTTEAGRARIVLGALLLSFERYEQARAILDAAIPILERAGDLEGLADAAAHLADVYAVLGEARDGLERVLPLYERARQAPASRGRARLCRGLASLYYTLSQTERWLECNERLAALAREIGDDSLLAEALAGRAGYLLRYGQFAESLALTETSMTLARRSGNLVSLVYAAHNGSMIHQATGNLDEDRLWICRARESAEQLGQATPLAHTLSRSGKHWFHAGDWHRAGADFERQLALAEGVGESWLTSYAHLDLGRLRLVTGRVAEGMALLERSIAHAEASGDAQALRQAHPALAEYELFAHHPHAARDRLLPLLGPDDDRAIFVTAFLPLLAWAELDLGDAQGCAERLATCERRATESGMRPALAHALRVRGLGAIHRGDRSAATESLRRALALSREIAYPYLEGKVLYSLGQMHAAANEQDEACSAFRQALGILRGLGERLYAERIERELAALSEA